MKERLNQLWEFEIGFMIAKYSLRTINSGISYLNFYQKRKSVWLMRFVNWNKLKLNWFNRLITHLTF